MKNRKYIFLILAMLCITLVVGVGYTIYKKIKDKPDELAAERDYTRKDIITVDGKEYKINSDVETILFMGIDKEALVELDGKPGENGQCDSLNLLVMNKETMEAQMIQISRDTIVDIDIYNSMDEKVSREPGQIALQYAYGDGEKKSCILTKDKVSDLLYGVDVDSYVSLTLDGMVKAADLIGGVTLTVPADYTYIDPTFIEGETITLDGKMTEKYVRERDFEALDGNVERMERQAQYMDALITKLQNVENLEQYKYIYEELEPYMVTDLTAEEMIDLSEYAIDREMMNLPGKIIEKDGYAQFIVDNEELQEIVLKTFYKRN